MHAKFDVSSFNHSKDMEGIGATTGTGGGPPIFRLGTNNVMVPELFGRGFQKARKQEIFQQLVTRMQDLAFEFF